MLNQGQVARSREDFLTAEETDSSAVRGTILASWRRSQSLEVAADSLDLPYIQDVRLDSRLAVSAEPVLRGLRQQLDGQSVSVILTDATGLVLRRLSGDGELERHLDRVLLAPGFSYAEKFAGTNGIGTALEVGGPAHVFGHEHYAEHLEDLACAGVPLHHPISGRLVGAVDLTCWRKDAGGLLLTLAKATAGQIRQALLADAGASQMNLFQEYMRTCSRHSGAVFAVNGDVVMLNDYARSVVDAADQAGLLAQAGEVRASGTSRTVTVALPSGRTARMFCRMVQEGDPDAGVVVHVRMSRDQDEGLRVAPDASAPPLPGLVGSGPPWLHTCHEVERVFKRGEWLAVQGEPGVGKAALLRAVQLRRHPVGRFVMLDAAEASTNPGWLQEARNTLRDGDAVVIRHVDRLGDSARRNFSAALQEARAQSRERPLWVAVTLATAESREESLNDVLRWFPTTVEVPPLRLHVEDVPALVGFFLSRLGQGGHLACSSAAMRLLMRMSWPGNVEQVHQLLREVVRHRRTGTIEPEDLPPEAHTLSRRMLTPLEAMERDAIVRCLTEANGNKQRAARSLGMSRATIYRKIHEYGIVPPAGSPGSVSH